MPFYPNCRGEFQDWVTICPDCSVPLVDTLPPEPPKPQKHPKLPRPDIKDITDISIAARFSYPAEAHLAAAKLESEGIPAFVADEHTLSNLWMYSVALGGVKVWVRKQDVETALTILEYKENANQNTYTTDTCPVCPSPDIHFEYFNMRPMFIIWLVTALVIGRGGFMFSFVKRKWVCRSCGYQWKKKQENVPQTI